ncbi:unnamed protein product [Microthlaspi erraticum]|uniref:Uncharacterized protein n=1 Tax=Microthlaspi erraticum TaxID=1685480 RepID=A0A6D2HSG0_9BRAS|nr:unnamed protein product [Microthlaspi erraticum]
MKFHRRGFCAVEVVDGKIYVIGGGYKGDKGMQVEVFDPKTRIWSFAGRRNSDGYLRRIAPLWRGRFWWWMLTVIKWRYMIQDKVKERSGFMWFDTKLSVWTRLVMSESDYVFDVTDYFNVDAMVEYHGKLAVFWRRKILDNSVCGLMMALDKVGDRIRGKIEWSGVVATSVPNNCMIEHWFAVSH